MAPTARTLDEKNRVAEERAHGEGSFRETWWHFVVGEYSKGIS